MMHRCMIHIMYQAYDTIKHNPIYFSTSQVFFITGFSRELSRLIKRLNFLKTLSKGSFNSFGPSFIDRQFLGLNSAERLFSPVPTHFMLRENVVHTLMLYSSSTGYLSFEFALRMHSSAQACRRHPGSTTHVQIYLIRYNTSVSQSTTIQNVRCGERW